MKAISIRKSFLCTAIFFVLIVSLFALNESEEVVGYGHIPTENLDTASSRKAFKTMMDVLTHERCINCHPNDNIPKQGEDSHAHRFGITGGDNNHGYQATKCSTCHQSENNEYSGVPGAPHWGLAPASMGWQGLSRKEIAENMLNPELNGGKNHDELVKHMTEDELVLWAWAPGVDADGKPREAPPVSESDFKAAVKEWFAEGAVIPETQSE